MRVCVLDDSGVPVRDEARNLQEVELQPCDDCVAHKWPEGERAAVQKGLKVVWLFSKFEDEAWHAQAADEMQQCCYDTEWLGETSEKVPELWELDGDAIRLLKGALQVAVFAHVTDLELEQVRAAYTRIEEFICHLAEHLDDDGRPLAPWTYFRPIYPTWVTPQNWLRWLPHVRGKTSDEVYEWLTKEWQALPRCKRCCAVLMFEEQESTSGLCIKCEEGKGAPCPEHGMEPGGNPR